MGSKSPINATTLPFLIFLRSNFVADNISLKSISLFSVIKNLRLLSFHMDAK